MPDGVVVVFLALVVGAAFYVAVTVGAGIPLVPRLYRCRECRYVAYTLADATEHAAEHQTAEWGDRCRCGHQRRLHEEGFGDCFDVASEGLRIGRCACQRFRAAASERRAA